jgi:hypothetical protein
MMIYPCQCGYIDTSRTFIMLKNWTLAVLTDGEYLGLRQMFSRNMAEPCYGCRQLSSSYVFRSVPAAGVRSQELILILTS